MFHVRCFWDGKKKLVHFVHPGCPPLVEQSTLVERRFVRRASDPLTTDETREDPLELLELLVVSRLRVGEMNSLSFSLWDLPSGSHFLSRNGRDESMDPHVPARAWILLHRTWQQRRRKSDFG